MVKHNKKGRSNSGGRFLQLHNYILESAAWRSLKTHDRAVYIAVAQHYDGKNNGCIALGYRRMGAVAGVNKDTAQKACDRLQAVGLLELAVENDGSGFILKHASVWRLTQHRCDRTGQQGSKAFLKWRPENLETGPVRRDTASHPVGHPTVSEVESVPPRRTERAA